MRRHAFALPRRGHCAVRCPCDVEETGGGFGPRRPREPKIPCNIHNSQLANSHCCPRLNGIPCIQYAGRHPSTNRGDGGSPKAGTMMTAARWRLGGFCQQSWQHGFGLLSEESARGAMMKQAAACKIFLLHPGCIRYLTCESRGRTRQKWACPGARRAWLRHRD
jgi:hypothetical protein